MPQQNQPLKRGTVTTSGYPAAPAGDGRHHFLPPHSEDCCVASLCILMVLNAA